MAGRMEDAIKTRWQKAMCMNTCIRCVAFGMKGPDVLHSEAFHSDIYNIGHWAAFEYHSQL